MESAQKNNVRYQPAQSTLSDKLDYMSSASFMSRAVAFIIDILAIWGLSQIIIYPVVQLSGMGDLYFLAPALSIANIASGILYFAYFVLMTHFTRATLGKMVTGVTVVSRNADKLTFTQVIFRELIGRYINNFLWYLPYLLVLFTERRIGLHDYFADTYVVKNSYYQYKNEIKKRIIKDEEIKYQEDDLYNGRSHVSR
ncbi:RDD family protein [Salinicoccus sp. YB14-2]|uniref:RDD family protein n=1 Tax=Salinicoccus sp. YB14-2 TaxID=1572701 RepID=UPI00068E2589|nr:RDD family protein [Salinicoccus sp. YB14-2]